MYQQILIPLENSSADETILAHIKPLARLTNARIHLVHVADGWVARNFNQLQLAESEEMKQDRLYLEERQRELMDDGFFCDAVLALGEPSDEIIKLAREKEIDLIAMTTHGHRFISDMLYGATVDIVRPGLDLVPARMPTGAGFSRERITTFRSSLPCIHWSRCALGNGNS